MGPNRSKFLVHEETATVSRWANYADENVLLATMQHGKPWADLTSPVMEYVSTAMPSLEYGRTPLQDFLMGSGRVRTVESDYIKWRLRGTGETQAIQLENLSAGNLTPGVQGALIPIVLDLETYVIGDNLAPDRAKDIQVRVETDPEAYGQGFLYYVKLNDRNPNGYFPPNLLNPGLKWIKIDATYGEASHGYGSVQFQGPSWIEFESGLTHTGKKVKVTNKAHNLNLKLLTLGKTGLPLKDYPPQIISYIEAQFLAEIKWEKEKRLFYGRSNGNRQIDGTSGYEVQTGPGLLEFLEDGNVVEYNRSTFSLKMFKDYLKTVWFDRVAPANRKVVVFTGQGGLEQINEAILAEYGASSIVSDFDTFVGKNGTTYGDGYKGLVYQTAFFTEIQMFPFGHIRFEHWPILDSMHLNGSVLDPDTGLPTSTYQYIIADTGTGNGLGSNIELIKRANEEAYTYICGTWSPAGPIKGGSRYMSAHDGRYYELTHSDTFGIRVKDITMSAWFIPAAG